MSNLIAPCSKCGQKNRMPDDLGNSTVRKIRCGKCRAYEFTDEDLMKASIAQNLGAHGVDRVEWDDGSGFDFKGYRP